MTFRNVASGEVFCAIGRNLTAKSRVFDLVNSVISNHAVSETIMTTVIKDKVALPALEVVYVFPLLFALVSALNAELSRLVAEMEELNEEERLLVILGALEAGKFVSRVQDTDGAAFTLSDRAVALMDLHDLTEKEFERAFCPLVMLKLKAPVGWLNTNAALIAKLSDLIASYSLRARWRALGTVFIGLGKGHVVVKGAEGTELTLKITKAGEREGWGKRGNSLQFGLLRPGSLTRH